MRSGRHGVASGIEFAPICDCEPLSPPRAQLCGEAAGCGGSAARRDPPPQPPEICRIHDLQWTVDQRDRRTLKPRLEEDYVVLTSYYRQRFAQARQAVVGDHVAGRGDGEVCHALIPQLDRNRYPWLTVRPRGSNHERSGASRRSVACDATTAPGGRRMPPSFDRIPATSGEPRPRADR